MKQKKETASTLSVYNNDGNKVKVFVPENEGQQPDKKAIVDSIYKTYSSDSGVLFGIKERTIVEAIVEFTINRINKVI